ncbi:RNA-processing protein [Candidatus Bathyarchaeota archaeon]|nr:MAG: RNA-processing protein [Candidatus Bathyarchaeota archaeon]
MNVFRIRIPKQRVGVVIGSKGEVKRRIEKSCRVKLNIDSSTGDVEIIQTDEGDPVSCLIAKNIVLAIGRGFSPERAFRLLDEDAMLEIIDLKDDLGFSKNAVKRIQGRIIGREGKARRMIEELTGVYISVYGDTVALIGKSPWFEVAKEAVWMLIEGRQHSTVYKYLTRERRRIKRLEMDIWKRPEEVI